MMSTLGMGSILQFGTNTPWKRVALACATNSKLIFARFKSAKMGYYPRHWTT